MTAKPLGFWVTPFLLAPRQRPAPAGLSARCSTIIRRATDSFRTRPMLSERLASSSAASALLFLLGLFRLVGIKPRTQQVVQQVAERGCQGRSRLAFGSKRLSAVPFKRGVDFRIAELPVDLRTVERTSEVPPRIRNSVAIPSRRRAAVSSSQLRQRGTVSHKAW